MPPKKTAQAAHPAVLGLSHYLNTAPRDALKSGVSGELARRSGMDKVAMYEYIGRKAALPKKVTEAAAQAAEHFHILGK